MWGVHLQKHKLLISFVQKILQKIHLVTILRHSMSLQPFQRDDRGGEMRRDYFSFSGQRKPERKSV